MEEEEESCRTFHSQFCIFPRLHGQGGGSEREPSGLVQGLCIQLGVCGPLGLENGFLKAKNKLDDMIKKKVVI